MDAEQAARSLSSYRRNVEAQTGKTIEQIFALLKTAGAKTHSEMVNYLKSDLKLGHGHASFVVGAFKNAAFAKASEKAVAEDERPLKRARAKKAPAKAAATKPAKKK